MLIPHPLSVAQHPSGVLTDGNPSTRLPIGYILFTDGRHPTTATADRIKRNPSLARQAYMAMVEDIAAGTLTSGERIRIEHLAAHLGVSPTPVREAIACLVQE